MRAVDTVVATLDSALSKQGETLAALERWKAEMPTEQEMLPKDKYTLFARYEKKYRKGIHSKFPAQYRLGKDVDLTNSCAELPKWTRVSQRVNPPGY